MTPSAMVQQMVPGYTYKKFCARVMSACCGGYTVSFLGMRVVYYSPHR